MIIRCKTCSKEYLGNMGKQSMRLHLQAKHGHLVSNVMQSEFVEVVDIEKEQGVQEKPVPGEEKPCKNEQNGYILITEALKQGLNQNMQNVLRNAQKQGYFEVDIEKGLLRG